MSKIDDLTLGILSAASVEGDVVILNCGQLDRKRYVDVNKVLEAMGGKWNRKVKGHVFSESPTDKLEAIILTGEYDKPADYGYFPTPMDLADKMITLANLTPGMVVLEPSAGQGAIAERVARIVGYDNVHCFELLNDNCEALMKYGFLKTECCDFLSVEPKPLYDRVIMNPPFAKQQDIEHVTHALKCVKPGGRLVSIMASGVTFRQNRKTTEFLDLIGDSEIINNPPESFKLSGTMVNTVTVIVCV
uniref:Putative methyltransferase n=1 Tax=viral metagenome TaxID=1070528 RepID=A0A6M3Y1L7_9ZZZZ